MSKGPSVLFEIERSSRFHCSFNGLNGLLAFIVFYKPKTLLNLKFIINFIDWL